MSKETVGIIIGRFQVDELHEGHRAMIDHVFAQNHKQVIFLLGFRNTPATEENPLSFGIRSRMIKDAYPDAIVWALEDMRDDRMWSAHVDEVLSEYDDMCSTKEHEIEHEFILYCGRNSFQSHYTGKYPIEEVDFNVSHVNATERREFHGKNPKISSVEFRQGVIHALHNLPPRIYLTVDIALVRDTRHVITNPTLSIDVLMARKPFEDKWRLPGGFVEMGESFIEAAKRELLEETGLIIESGAAIIGDYPISDWRIRDAKKVSHKTVLVTGWHSWGAAIALDDIEEVKWFPLTELVTNTILLVMEEHHILIDALSKHFGSKAEQPTLTKGEYE